MLPFRAACLAVLAVVSISLMFAILFPTSMEDFEKSAKLRETRCVVLSGEVKDDVGQLAVRFWDRDPDDADAEPFDRNATGLAVDGYDNTTHGTEEQEEMFVDGYKEADDEPTFWYKCYYNPDDISEFSLTICGSDANLTTDAEKKDCKMQRKNCKETKTGLDCRAIYPKDGFVSMRKPLSGAFVIVVFLIVVSVIALLGVGVSLYLKPQDVSPEAFIRINRWGIAFDERTVLK